MECETSLHEETTNLDDTSHPEGETTLDREPGESSHTDSADENMLEVRYALFIPFGRVKI